MELPKFIEYYYWIFNIPYYKCYVVKDQEIVKTLIQKLVAAKDGENLAIIAPEMKKAWWKLPEICFRSGKTFIMYLPLDNAIPLVEDTKINTTGDLFIKEVTSSRLIKETLSGSKEASGKAVKFNEVVFPPDLLHEALRGHFVLEAISNPPSVLEEYWKIALVIGGALVLIFWMITSSGMLTGLQGIHL
jgi:hypothetical protein